MATYSADVEKQMQRLYSSLNEKDRRRYAAIEAIKIGWGGISYISQLFGCDYYTLKFGMQELDDEEAMGRSEVRRQGGGRKSSLESIEGLDAAFLTVLSKHTAGSPMNEKVKWTNLKRSEIAELLKTEGIKVSVTVVDQLLEQHGYRRRQAQKRLKAGDNPQRNEQFENIEELIEAHEAEGDPIISMDTKKKK